MIPDERAQGLVAGQVAELVVVGLEVVHVADRDGELIAALAVIGLDPGQVIGQSAPVAHAGERIVAGVLDQSLVDAREFGLALGEVGHGPAFALEQPAQAAREQVTAEHERTAAEQQPAGQHHSRSQCVVGELGLDEGSAQERRTPHPGAARRAPRAR